MLKIFFILQLRSDRTTNFRTLYSTIKEISKNAIITLHQNIELAISAVTKKIVEFIADFLRFLDRRYASGLTSIKNYNKETVLYIKSKTPDEGEVKNFAAINLQHDQPRDIMQSSRTRCKEKQLSHKSTDAIHLPTVARAVTILPLDNANYDGAKIPDSCKISTSKHILTPKSSINPDTPLNRTPYRPIYHRSMSLPLKIAEHTSTDLTQLKLCTLPTIQSTAGTNRVELKGPIGLIKNVGVLTTATEILLQSYLSDLKRQTTEPGRAMKQVLAKLNEQQGITPQDDKFDALMLLSALLHSTAIKSSTAETVINFDTPQLPEKWEKAVQSCCKPEEMETLWNKEELSIFTTINHYIESIRRETEFPAKLSKENEVYTSYNQIPPVTPPLPTIEIQKDYLELEDTIESYCKQLNTSAIKPGKALQNTLEKLKQTNDTVPENAKFCVEGLFLALLHSAVSSATTNTDSASKKNTLLRYLMCCMSCTDYELGINNATKLLFDSMPYLAECSSLSNQDLHTESWNATEQLILSKAFNIARAASIITESDALPQYTDEHAVHNQMVVEPNSSIENIKTHPKRQHIEHAESSTKDIEGYNKASEYNGLIVFSKKVAELLSKYQQNLERYETQHGRAMKIVLEHFGQNPKKELAPDSHNSQFLLSSLMYAKNIADPTQGNENFSSEIPTWSKQEWEIFSNIAYFLVCNISPDSINDALKNCSRSTIEILAQHTQQLETIATEQNSTVKPHAMLVFITSPLLTVDSPDYQDIVSQEFNIIKQKQYYSAVKERLLPSLVIINEIAKKQGKKAWVCIPEINADYSAGQFSDSMYEIFYNALKNLLREHVAKLTAVEFVCLKPGIHQNENKKCTDAHSALHQISKEAPIKIDMQHTTEAEPLNFIVLPCAHPECNNPNPPAEGDNQENHFTCRFDPSRHIPFIFVANTKTPLPGTKEFTNFTGYSYQDRLTRRLFIPASDMFDSQKIEDLEVMRLNLKYTTKQQNAYHENKPFSYPSTNMHNIETELTLPYQTQSAVINR